MKKYFNPGFIVELGEKDDTVYPDGSYVITVAP